MVFRYPFRKKKMSLVTTVESFTKRPLSAADVASLTAFQKQFNIEDDDPMMVVLAMMARGQIIVDSAPDLLQQKVTETIELHRNVLRDQATLIAKDLIVVLANDIEKSVFTKYKSRAASYAGFFVGGMVFSVVLFAIFKWVGR